ncbi:uncharacterized protein AB9W97_005789 isoform 2-T2 [Spinachia spinachia]
MRHYRALHENKEETGASPSQATRKQELDEALKDTQPCSIVDDAGFRAFVSKLDPNYVPPTRRSLQQDTMIDGVKCGTEVQQDKKRDESLV